MRNPFPVATRARNVLSPGLILTVWLVLAVTLTAQTASESVLVSPTGTPAQELSAGVAPAPDRHLQDEAHLVKDPVGRQILAACQEIEQQMRIRILIRTEILDDLSQYQQRVEQFFSEWIRSISLDKRGILLYAALPKDSLQGRFNLRVGIGLKYLITREMGEKILNRVILPNNAENSDGKGFLEGVLTIKRMLLDELKRENVRQVFPTGQFDLAGFLWASKEIVMALLVGLFLCYLVFFIERCPRCNGTLRISYEILKDAGHNTLGLRRKIFSCERCGFARRKKEPIYPSGMAGFRMWLSGTRRNLRLDTPPASPPPDLTSGDRQNPPD